MMEQAIRPSCHHTATGYESYMRLTEGDGAGGWNRTSDLR